MPLSLDDLRRFAVARTLFPPTSLGKALERLAFVQADPIRAPARAQDLTLRHRVRHYRAGDLERRYRTLPVEEDFFVNYGFVSRQVQALMHPRTSAAGTPGGRRRTAALLDFVRVRGVVHPREVDAHFAHGSVTNYWGGSSSATTHLLEDMHFRGLLRVAGRDAGVRLYAVHAHGAGPTGPPDRDARLDRLVDTVVRVYAPLPRATLSWLVNRLRYAVPQWRRYLKPTLRRAVERLAHERIDGVDWFWPPDERLPHQSAAESVRLLTPFDPLVWDRRRFELLWGWAYRFEAYTPAAKRSLGYYALPMLWRDQVIGWANVTIRSDQLAPTFGYIDGTPKDTRFIVERDAELERLRLFLGKRA